MPKDAITFRAKVVAVEEKFDSIWVSGVGKGAVFQERSKGWFIGLEGSYEFLYAGPIKPNIDVGDMAMTRIEFYAGK